MKKSLLAYKTFISKSIKFLFGGGCRFTPTCSEYAADAVGKYGIVKGTALAGWRIVRCNPLSKGGVDPVK